MDNSRKKSGSFFQIILLLGGSFLLAVFIALSLFWIVQALFPAAPDTNGQPKAWILGFFVLALIPILIWVARRFPIVTDWYYLLPAVVFLLAFTVYPIALTIMYGFTDYSGQRNNHPDRSSETEIIKIENRTLTSGVSFAESLGCDKLDCEGVTLELVADNQRERVNVLKAEGTTLELDKAPTIAAQYAYRINAYHFVGLRNYVEIISQAGAILWPVFIWNVVFAFGAVAAGAIPGFILGLILNNKNLHFRGFYRTALIISWAIPIVISYQMIGAMMNVNFGSINRLLGLFGAYPIPWTSDPDWAKVAILVASAWAGFPYWMTATLSTLTTISEDVYEAAKIDGANGYQMLTGITLPLIRKPFIPLLLGSFAFNFNNFALIYLLINPQPPVEGRPSTAQAVDILISWAYKTAFQADGGQAFGLGGAISVLIFAITVFISLINFRFTGALKEVR